jgi:hypothetical protein
MPSDDALVGWVNGYQPHPGFSVLPLRFWKCPKLLELQSHLVQAFVRWNAIERALAMSPTWAHGRGPACGGPSLALPRFQVLRAHPPGSYCWGLYWSRGEC